MRLRSSTWLAWLALVMVSGCTSAGASSESTASSVALQALGDARDAGASDAQVATLEHAVSTGSVVIEEVREAARRTVSCMQAAGLDARYDERTLSHGVVVPGYLVDVAPDQDVDAEVESCDEREFHWISKTYQLQPSSIEAAEQFVEQRAPAIRACLERNGVTTRADDSGHDLATTSSRAMNESGGAVSCLAEAGVDVW